jgi:hypothetical protein
MWPRSKVKAAVLRSWAPLYYPVCCAAVGAAGNCRLSTAAPVVACHDMSVTVIEEIANPTDV